MGGLSKLAVNQSGKGNSIAPSSGANAGTNYSSSPVNVMPTALNLGQIIQPYTQPSATGGAGLSLPSALAGSYNANAGLFTASAGGSKIMLYGGIAAFGLLLVWLAWKA